MPLIDVSDTNAHLYAYFDGETEPCINGIAVANGAYLGQEVDGIVERLLDDQLPDGGWNCWAEYGATVSSFHRFQEARSIPASTPAARTARTSCTRPSTSTSWTPPGRPTRSTR